jgi:hypothetical protein
MKLLRLSQKFAICALVKNFLQIWIFYRFGYFTDFSFSFISVPMGCFAIRGGICGAIATGGLPLLTKS